MFGATDRTVTRWLSSTEGTLISSRFHIHNILAHLAVDTLSRSAAATKLLDSTTWRNTRMLASVLASGVRGNDRRSSACLGVARTRRASEMTK
jgi:hypothetical protein